MRGDKTGAYVISTNADVCRHIESAFSGWVDGVYCDADSNGTINRIRLQFVDHKIAPKLCIVDAAVSEGLAECIQHIKTEHTLLYVLVSGQNLAHSTIVEAMRALADNCVDLSHLNASYLPQLEVDIEARSHRNPVKTIANFHKKKLRSGNGKRDRAAEIKHKFEEFGLQFTDHFHQPSTVLVVDDEPGNRFMVTEYLEPEGYQVLQAENGKKALQILSENPQIDVVILDVRMPEMTGDQVLAKMAELNTNAEVIMLTAFKDKEVVQNTFRDNAFDYINKPLKPDILLEKVAKAQRYRYGKVEANLDLPLADRKNYLKAFLAASQSANRLVLNKDAEVFVPELFSEQSNLGELFDSARIEAI